MSRLARILMRRYDSGRLTLEAIADAWDYQYIEADEFGAIIGGAS
jgi:hypothetical protein